MLAFPDATKTPDELTGRLPLHWACICKASISILRLLLDHYPAALASLDSFDGRLPLHYACMYGSADMVELLVSLEKRAVVYKDNNGLTPFDLIEQSRNNPHRDSILKILEDAKNELEIAKQKRHREREKAANAAAAAAAAAAGNNQDHLPSSPRKLPPVPSKELRTPNTSNATKPKYKSDWSVQSDMDNAASVDMQSASPSLMTAPDSGKNRKRSSLRTLLGRVGGGGSSKLPPTSSLPIVTSPLTTTFPASPLDESYATGQAVAGSPWASHGANGSGAAIYSRNMASSNSLQSAATPSQVRFSLQRLPDGRQAPVDKSHSTLPEPPLTRAQPAVKSSNMESERYAKAVAKAPPGNNQNRYGSNDGHSTSSAARSEAFPFAQELSFQREKLTEKDAELEALDSQVRMLELRGQALLDGCQNAEASVLEKQNLVDRKQSTISRIKAQLAQLQKELEAEEAALELAESSLMVNRETLSEHEQKMRATEEEKKTLLAIRASVLDQKREIQQSVSTLEVEMKSM